MFNWLTNNQESTPFWDWNKECRPRRANEWRLRRLRGCDVIISKDALAGLLNASNTAHRTIEHAFTATLGT
jgi:hypothetical protein